MPLTVSGYRGMETPVSVSTLGRRAPGAMVDGFTLVKERCWGMLQLNKKRMDYVLQLTFLHLTYIPHAVCDTLVRLRTRCLSRRSSAANQKRAVAEVEPGFL